MTSRSPIHDWLELQQPVTTQSVALEDLGVLCKFGVKGPDAEKFLTGQEVDVPKAIYESCPLSDGLIVRLAADEFMLEVATANESIQGVLSKLRSTDLQVFHVERQEATFLLSGRRANDVLAQTCGVNFREAPNRHLVLTRVAGVSCGVFPESTSNRSFFRLWVDYSYAAYLWDVLNQISEELCDGMQMESAKPINDLRA